MKNKIICLNPQKIEVKNKFIFDNEIIKILPRVYVKSGCKKTFYDTSIPYNIKYRVCIPKGNTVISEEYKYRKNLRYNKYKNQCPWCYSTNTVNTERIKTEIKPKIKPIKGVCVDCGKHYKYIQNTTRCKKCRPIHQRENDRLSKQVERLNLKGIISKNFQALISSKTTDELEDLWIYYSNKRNEEIKKGIYDVNLYKILLSLTKTIETRQLEFISKNDNLDRDFKEENRKLLGNFPPRKYRYGDKRGHLTPFGSMESKKTPVLSGSFKGEMREKTQITPWMPIEPLNDEDKNKMNPSDFKSSAKESDYPKEIGRKIFQDKEHKKILLKGVQEKERYFWDRRMIDAIFRPWDKTPKINTEKPDLRKIYKNWDYHKDLKYYHREKNPPT